MNLHQFVLFGYEILCCQRIVGCELSAGKRHLLTSHKDITRVSAALSGAEAQLLSHSVGGGAHQRGKGFQIDSPLDGQSPQCVHTAIMLAEEDEHGIIEDVDISEARLLGALSLIVEDAHGQIPVLVAAFEQSITEVDILALHKEILV